MVKPFTSLLKLQLLVRLTSRRVLMAEDRGRDRIVVFPMDGYPVLLSIRAIKLRTLSMPPRTLGYLNRLTAPEIGFPMATACPMFAFPTFICRRMGVFSWRLPTAAVYGNCRP